MKSKFYIIPLVLIVYVIFSETFPLIAKIVLDSFKSNNPLVIAITLPIIIVFIFSVIPKFILGTFLFASAMITSSTFPLKFLHTEIGAPVPTGLSFAGHVLYIAICLLIIGFITYIISRRKKSGVNVIAQASTLPTNL